MFIDDHHTICAVGYLIEQSAGRPLAEKIAQQHRYDFIEDIAADMPEVQAWIAVGRFARGYVAGTWRHYDVKGALLATSVVDTPASFRKPDQLFWSIGYLVDIVPTSDHIEHHIHQGSRARAERITTLVHSMSEVRAASPAFLQKLALGEEAPTDLTNVIASNMSLDIEWPHVDRRLIEVYQTLPGYAHE